MAIATKRPVTAKTGMTKTGMNLSAGKNSRRNAVKPTILPDGDVPTDGEMADAVAADKMVDTIIGTMNNAQQQDGPDDPAAQLVGMQMRTLADLCEALDKKCLELAEEATAARAAVAVSEPAIATLNHKLAEERGLRAKLERELAEARRVHGQERIHISATHELELIDLSEKHERELTEARLVQTMLERELATLRLNTDTVNRVSLDASSGNSRSKAAARGSVGVNGEHAARLLPLLEASFISGKMTAVHDPVRALARFRAAGMIDAIEGTREAPICHGWLLSRSDLHAEPIMFLMDDVGLLGWADAKIERSDVSVTHLNTKPRSGFETPLSRMPVGQLRGIVAVMEAGGEGATFFEATKKQVS